MAPMEEFIEMLKSHNRIVFFGGAGVCTAKRRSFPGRRKKCSPIIFMRSIPWNFLPSTKRGRA